MKPQAFHGKIRYVKEPSPKEEAFIAPNRRSESKEEYDRLVSYALELRNKKRKRRMKTPRKNQCSIQYQLVNGVFYYLLTSEEYPYILAKHEEVKEAAKLLDDMIDKNRLGDDDEF